MVAEKDNNKAKAPESKTHFEASATLVCCLKGELTRLKASQVKEIWDAIYCNAAYQFVWLDPFSWEMTVVKKTCRDSLAAFCLLAKNYARDWEKTLHRHKLSIIFHHQKVISLHEQAKDSEKTNTNIENRHKTILSLCSLPNQVLGGRSAVSGQCFKGSSKTFDTHLPRV